MKPSKFKIKSGEEIIIRLATLEDAQALLEMKLKYLKNSNTIPLYQNEYPNDLAFEVQLIKRLEHEENSVLFVAEYKKRLIGNIDVNGNQRTKLYHTGVVGLGILQKWRGKGVGFALMKAVEEWSINNRFIALLWLEVYNSNKAGIALYQKMRFSECGRIQNFFCEENEYIDKITMVRHL